MITLRNYQNQAIDRVVALESRGVMRSVLAMCTGSGKTATAAALIARRPGRALFTAPFDEIVSQTVKAMQRAMPNRRVGIVKAELNQWNAEVVVASLQTLARAGGKRLHYAPRDFSTIVVDECHLQIDAYTRVLNELAQERTLVLGTSATPTRLDGRDLDEVFNEVAFEFSIVDGIEQGYLSEIEAYEFTLPNADFSKVRTRKGDLEIKELETVMQAANYAEHITAKWREYATDRHTVVFVPKVAMAAHLAGYMREQGIRAEMMDGSMPKAQRAAILARYHSGETSVICNVMVLSIGWDSPVTDCLILARPTKSQALTIQMLGRALRIHPGKRNALILDMVSATRGDLFSVASLAGVARLEKGEKFTEAKRRSAEEAAEAEEAARLEEQLQVARIDLLRRQQQDAKWEVQKAAKRAHFERQAQAGAFHWLKVDSGERMTVRAGAVLYVFRLRQLPDGLWQARLIISKADGASPSDWPGAIKRTAAEARGAAEAKARELLDAAKPAWMMQEASEAQLMQLRKFRIPFSPSIRKGEASTLITQTIERLRTRKAVRA